jgi:hypothetical protein
MLRVSSAMLSAADPDRQPQVSPPLKHDHKRARHGEWVAVPGCWTGVGGEGAVRAMIVDEVFMHILSPKRKGLLIDDHRGLLN